MEAMCPALVAAEKVYTGFRPTRYVEALVVYGGVVVYAGERRRAEEVAGELARLTGCGRPRLLEYGGVALPGFVDAHLHVQGIGVARHAVWLGDVESVEELVKRVAVEAARFPGWVVGRGWDQERLGGWPTRYDLDEAVPGKPVVLLRVCGHAAVLNTEAMRRLGLLGSDSPLVDRGCDGEPTGIVYEDLAVEAYRRAVESLGPERLVLEAAEEILRNGITLAGAMDVEAPALAALMKAWASGALRLRLRLYLSRSLFERLDALGAVPLAGDALLRVAGVKVYMDGSLGAGTAWLSEPYSDGSGRGRRLMTAGELASLARRAQRWGLDVAAHAIGDAAIEEALRGYREAGCRCRIEHASLAPPRLVEELAGFRVAAQPRFLLSDWWAPSRLGEERAKWLYPFRSMLAHGVELGFSSDAPVEPLNPLEGVYAAVTRGSLLSYTRGEELDVETALHLYTRGSAEVLEEPRAGCLEPGCFGDVVVLPADPLSVDVEELPGLEPEATIVGGEVAWEKR